MHLAPFLKINKNTFLIMKFSRKTLRKQRKITENLKIIKLMHYLAEDTQNKSQRDKDIIH